MTADYIETYKNSPPPDTPNPRYRAAFKIRLTFSRYPNLQAEAADTSSLSGSLPRVDPLALPLASVLLGSGDIFILSIAVSLPRNRSSITDRFPAVLLSRFFSPTN